MKNRLVLASFVAFFFFLVPFIAKGQDGMESPFAAVEVWGPSLAPKPFMLIGANPSANRIRTEWVDATHCRIIYDTDGIVGTFRMERATNPGGVYQSPTSGQITGVVVSGPVITWTIDLGRFPPGFFIRVKTPLTTQTTLQWLTVPWEIQTLQ